MQKSTSWDFFYPQKRNFYTYCIYLLLIVHFICSLENSYDQITIKAKKLCLLLKQCCQIQNQNLFLDHKLIILDNLFVCFIHRLKTKILDLATLLEKQTNHFWNLSTQLLFREQMNWAIKIQKFTCEDCGGRCEAGISCW